MTTITISLPESLTQYLQAQIASGSYNTASEYIQALIQQDQQHQAQAQLETLVLEGLHSQPTTPMTTDDWDTIRATVQQRISADQQLPNG